MREHRRWTEDRDRLLRETYLALGLQAAAAALGATRSAVKNRVHQLGLRRPDRAWTAQEDAVVRAGYSGLRSAESIALELGRGAPAVRRRAFILGVRCGRLWSQAEIEAVRSGYRDKGCAALAVELLGADTPVTRHAIYGLASKLGVTVPIRHPRWVYDRVRLLHGQGRNDSQIARDPRLASYFPGRNNRERVTAIRRRLGLPAIRQTAEQLRELGRRTRAAQDAAGVNPRDQAFARLAVSYGLPADTAPRAVEIILALVAGPKSQCELKAAGLHPDRLWNAEGTSYAAGLVRRGLVATIPLGTNRGPRVLYVLTAAALDLLAKGGHCAAANG